MGAQSNLDWLEEAQKQANPCDAAPTETLIKARLLLLLLCHKHKPAESGQVPIVVGAGFEPQ